MPHEQTGQPETSAKKEKPPVKNRIIVAAVLGIVVFSAGFLPQYAKAKRLRNELQQARQENSLAQLRDLAALAYFETSQKNYGLAAGACARFFDRTRELANQPDSGTRKSLEDLVSFRDGITAGLAKGDPVVLNDVQTLFVRTRQATALSAGAPQAE
jgi:hypothetical protein